MGATIAIIIVAVYIALMLALGLIGYRVSRNTAEDFFLAGRSLGTFVGVMAMLTGLFSSFIFVGIAGIGYRLGLGVFVFVFACVLYPFWLCLIGPKLWKLGKERGYITPGDYLQDRFQSPELRVISCVVYMFLFVPVIVVEIVACGYILAEITAGALSYFVGIVVSVLAMLVYTILGGRRGVAWTQAAQGVILTVFGYLALAVIIYADGGNLSALISKVAQTSPDHLSIPGPFAAFSAPMWFSLLIIFGCGPLMFPHLWMTLFSLKSVETVKKTFLYLPLSAFVMIPGMLIGVLGITGFLAWKALRQMQFSQFC